MEETPTADIEVQKEGTEKYDDNNRKSVVCRVPATGTLSPRIAYRQSAINNSLASKPTPKPSPNPTLILP